MHCFPRLLFSSVGLMMGAAVAWAQGTWPEVLGTFGNLTTVAGSTFEAAANGDEWRAEYEGLVAFDPARPSDPPHLSEPHMAMDDAFGNLYIADKNGHGIRVLAPDGRLRTVAGRVVGDGGLEFDGDGPATERLVAYPNGLYVLPDGTFYVLEQGISGLTARIRRVDRAGQLTTLITAASADTIFNRGLWVSRDEGLIYFCAIEGGVGVVRKWTPAGGSTILATMPAGSEPGNLDVDAQGFVYQADRGLHRVYRIDPATGALTVVAGNGTASGGGDGQPATATGLEEVRGIAFHPLGGYFVCTHRASAVWYVDGEGLIHKVLSGTRNSTVREGDGQPLTANPTAVKISEPRSVRVGYSGDLILATNDCGWIRVVRALPGSAAQSPLSLALTMDGGPRLSFEAEAGHDYWIERSSSLEPKGWATLVEFPQAVAGLKTFMDPSAPPQAAYYRLIRTRAWP
jgi:DNA-binding beta-propeller fold protein YncE